HGLCGGGVAHSGGGAPSLPRCPRQGHGRVAHRVESLEGELAEGREVGWRGHAFEPVRIAERDGNRQVHVGNTELRLNAAVHELDHRVDHALRVHDDIDAAVGDVEEEVRLDHLEAFVHHGGGVDADLRPHLPAGMGDC